MYEDGIMGHYCHSCLITDQWSVSLSNKLYFQSFDWIRFVRPYTLHQCKMLVKCWNDPYIRVQDIRVLMYFGDMDMACNHLGGEWIADSLEMSVCIDVLHTELCELGSLFLCATTFLGLHRDCVRVRHAYHRWYTPLAANRHRIHQFGVRRDFSVKTRNSVATIICQGFVYITSISKEAKFGTVSSRHQIFMFRTSRNGHTWKRIWALFLTSKISWSMVDAVVGAQGYTLSELDVHIQECRRNVSIQRKSRLDFNFTVKIFVPVHLVLFYTP